MYEYFIENLVSATDILATMATVYVTLQLGEQVQMSGFDEIKHKMFFNLFAGKFC